MQGGFRFKKKFTPCGLYSKYRLFTLGSDDFVKMSDTGLWRLCGVVCIGIVLATWFLRRQSPHDVPAARLQKLEADVYAALDRSLASLQRERDELATENAVLKRKLAQQRAPVPVQQRAPVPVPNAPAVPAPRPAFASSSVQRLCGDGTSDVQAAVFWQNHHGLMVRRFVSIGDGRLSVCKRSSSPAVELTLGAGSVASTLGSSAKASMGFSVRVRSAGDGGTRAQEAVLQLSSEAERAAWLSALARSGVAIRGASAAAAATLPDDAFEGSPPPTPTARSTTAEAGGDSDSHAATLACHRRAIAFGADALSHRVQPLSIQRRLDFVARAAAAAAAAVTNDGPRPGAVERLGLALPDPAVSGHRYLAFERSFAHGLGHELLVYNLGVRLAAELNLTLLHSPLLSSSERGDHAELRGLAAALEAVLGLGQGAVPLKDAPQLRANGRTIPVRRLSRPCPDGAKKHVGGGAEWATVVRAVQAQRAVPSIFHVCGDLRTVLVEGSPAKSAKYDFGLTGAWWRARLAAAAKANPEAHSTPLFAAAEVAGAGSGAEARGATAAWAATSARSRMLNVAVHIRRGDMVYRNFATQLSPDEYYVQAMWHVLACVHAAASARHVSTVDTTAAAGTTASPASPRVVFHVFSQLPPVSSWTGDARVPLEGRGAPYVDELGCATSLREQLVRLVGIHPPAWPHWTLQMHLEVDPVASLLHMVKADVLIASDSSFSLAAAVLSSGLVLSRAGWKRFPRGARQGMRHAIELDADGGFEPAEAIAKLGAIIR